MPLVSLAIMGQNLAIFNAILSRCPSVVVDLMFLVNYITEECTFFTTVSQGELCGMGAGEGVSWCIFFCFCSCLFFGVCFDCQLYSICQWFCSCLLLVVGCRRYRLSLSRWLMFLLIVGRCLSIGVGCWLSMLAVNAGCRSFFPCCRCHEPNICKDTKP